MTTKRYSLVLLYFGVALAAAWTVGELERPVWDDPEAAPRIHESIVEGTADYPHQFRPLVPFLCEAGFRAGLPLRLTYLLQRLAFWFLALLLLHQYLRAWLSEELCLAGGLFLAAVLPFSVIATGFQPTDPLNLLLFVAAYRLLLTRQDRWLYVVVVVGMFNRETIALVALLAAAVRLDEWRTPRYWSLVLGLTLTAGAVYLGLHAWYGARESFTPLITPRENLPANLTRFGSIRAVVVYGVLWWLALTRLHDQPAFLRRSVILVPVFVVVHLAVGLIGESRYFLPLAPTILPLALRRIYPASAPEVAG